MANPNEPTSITVVESPEAVVVTTGAQGPPGLVGPTGPAGANGTNGTNGADGAPGVNAPQFLTGIVPPTGTDGAVGDFYIDTIEHILYGPKNEEGALPGPPYESSADPSWTPGTPGGSGFYELGSLIEVLSDGWIFGIRVYHDPALPVRDLRLWRYSDQSLLATVPSADTTGQSGWVDFLFDDPIVVTAGYYVPSFGYTDPSGFLVLEFPGAYDPPDHLRHDSSAVSLTIGTYPSSYSATSYYFADILFAASEEVWPMAIVSAPFPP